MDVFTVWQQHPGYDDGPSLHGVFSSRDAAMAAFPEVEWQAWAIDGPPYRSVPVRPGEPYPDGFGEPCSRGLLIDIERYTVDEVIEKL